MTELILSDGTKIKYFGHPKELPAGRFKDFQKYLFEDWGVGSTMQDVDLRLANAFNLIVTDKKDKALQELHNMRLTVNFIIEKLSVKSYAFAILIGQMDEIKLTDYSESALAEIVKRIEPLISQAQVEEVVETVKKNLKIR